MVDRHWTDVNFLHMRAGPRTQDLYPQIDALADPAATLLLGRGVHPKVVADMLGHSTVAITLDTYSHTTPAMQRGAARVMDGLFGHR